ncbi:MAG: OmpA family protein [Hyphomicrobiales bacterium]|nr:OmpA family protein [Hyphomicrobiales bacterium]
MCRPSRWLAGLIPLFLLFVAAIGIRAPEIQADLSTRTVRAIAGAGLDHPQVSVSGRDVAIAGASFSDASRQSAVATARSLDGVRLVADSTSLVAETRPFAFSATRTGDSIALTGVVPDPQVRASLIAAAKAIAPNVTDATTMGRGATPGFEGWAKAAILSLANLARGRADLVDNALSVTGESTDETAYAKALASLKSLPFGLSLAKADIKPPLASPYVWSAAADGQSLALNGFVPSADAHSAVVAAARAALPGRKIADNLQIARGAADGFSAWTDAALSALSKLSRGSASLADGRLTIVGETSSSDAYDAALAATRSPPPGLKLDANIAPPLVAPFAWSAKKDGQTITLEGFIPSEDTRGKIVEAARSAAPGASVVDHMKVGRGAAADFFADAQAALSALGRLGAGSAQLADRRLSVTGMTRDGQTADAFADALRASLPSGLTVAKNEVGAPAQHPYLFQAKKSADGAIALAGFAPSDALRDAARRAAGAAGARVSGDVAIAGGLPGDIDFAASTGFGLSALGALNSGEMVLGEDGLTVRGEGDEAAATNIRTAAGAPPRGVRIKLIDIVSREKPPAPAPPVPAAPRPLSPVEQACQKTLIDTVAEKNIQFRTGSADVEKSSEGVIDDLARVLKACPGVQVEVGGHTDNVGDAEMNKALSLERAQAVVSALGAAGVDASRLTAAGYGEERPIAPNDTREGRARNRRTEFVVK